VIPPSAERSPDSLLDESPYSAEDHPLHQAALGFLQRVVDDIVALKPRYPKLAEFDVARNVFPGSLIISYSFHVHAPERIGGWAGHVPNPDPDGIWLYIHLYDRRSRSMLDSQAVGPHYRVPFWGTVFDGAAAEMELFAIPFEGSSGSNVSGAIREILDRRAREAGGDRYFY
jgi:hypothetical protein